MDDLLHELEPPAPAPEERERRRRLVGAIGIAGLSLVTLGTLTTGAVFTDSDDLGANSFSTGTVLIGTTPASALFSVTNMAPGDTVYEPLTVLNQGSLDLRYAVTATATDPDTKALRGQLGFAVHSGVSAANCTAGNVAGGTQLYPAAGYQPIGAAANVFGSTAQGADAGDQNVAAGGSQLLCVVADLDLTTGNAFQNSATTVTFTFTAEQTKNNP